MKRTDDDILLNEHQVAGLIGLSLSKLRSDRWKRRGIVYFKLDRSVRYRAADVAEYIRRRRVEVAT